MDYHVKTYTNGEELPKIKSNNFFHSEDLFYITGEVNGVNAYMIVAFNSDDKPVAHLLVSTYRRMSWLPPYLYTIGRIYGEGDYENDNEPDREKIFGLMIEAATKKTRRNPFFFLEVSDMKQKMFGYKHFRKNNFFPIQWQEVHNSLHSRRPEERISQKLRERIDHCYNLGVETREIKNQDEVKDFYKMLNGFYRFKLRRFIPPQKQFEKLYENNNARIFITIYKQKVIGGCACIYSEGNAYLWYLASKRKSYPMLHPNTLTVWNAIKYAEQHNYAHIFFMDVGLPWKKNPFRDFILSFGGKPIGMYRWFRFNNSLINKILKWIYKE